MVRTGTQSRLHAGIQEALLSSWALAIALRLLVVKPAPLLHPLSAFHWHPGIRPALGLDSNFGARSPISILSTSCNQETWFGDWLYFFSLRALDLHRQHVVKNVYRNMHLCGENRRFVLGQASGCSCSLHFSLMRSHRLHLKDTGSSDLQHKPAQSLVINV